MANHPDTPKKPKAPKSKAPNSKASRPEVQPIGPALAELLNPAINRGESGMGSGTGLQPPPDNSWDRRAGGEAAAHRARKSTPKEFPKSASDPYPMPLRPNPQPAGGRGSSSDGRPSSPSPLAGEGRGGGSTGTDSVAAPTPDPSPQGGGEETRASASKNPGLSESAQREFAPANYGTSATIPTLDPELAKQLGFTTEEEDAAALARPPRNKMEALGVAATADALDALIRDGRPEFKGEDGQIKIWTPHRPPRPEKSEGGVPFVIKSEYEPKGDQPTAIKDLVEAFRATTARRCCSASPVPARPTPWPR